MDVNNKCSTFQDVLWACWNDLLGKITCNITFCPPQTTRDQLINKHKRSLVNAVLCRWSKQKYFKGEIKCIHLFKRPQYIMLCYAAMFQFQEIYGLPTHTFLDAFSRLTTWLRPLFYLPLNRCTLKPIESTYAPLWPNKRLKTHFRINWISYLIIYQLGLCLEPREKHHNKLLHKSLHCEQCSLCSLHYFFCKTKH